MRTSEDIAEWLIDCIHHTYTRPEMYAVTQSELDGRLNMLHRTWAYAVDRERDFCRLYQPICQPEAIAKRPEGFFDKISDKEALAMVVNHYQELDRRLGLIV